MDTAQWPQEIVVKPLDEIVTNTCPKQPQTQLQPQRSETVGAGGGGEMMRKARPEKDQALNCPRCNSTKTKFCYYNNYSLTQPRYFCKGCRRYWTEGGSLRNIPVGGGSRKNKRSHHQNHQTTSNIMLDHHQPPQKKHLSEQLMMSQQGLTSQNPKFLHETTQQDLNLGFSPHGFRSNFTDLIHNIGNSNNNGNSSSFMGFPIHNQDPLTSGNFSIQDHYKPISTTNPTLLGFPLDHQNGFNGGFQGDQDQEEEERGSRNLFPFDDLKLPVSTSSAASISIDINDASAATTSAGYWTGMLSGGSW